MEGQGTQGNAREGLKGKAVQGSGTGLGQCLERPWQCWVTVAEHEPRVSPKGGQGHLGCTCNSCGQQDQASDFPLFWVLVRARLEC